MTTHTIRLMQQPDNLVENPEGFSPPVIPINLARLLPEYFARAPDDWFVGNTPTDVETYTMRRSVKRVLAPHITADSAGSIVVFDEERYNLNRSDQSREKRGRTDHSHRNGVRQLYLACISVAYQRGIRPRWWDNPRLGVSGRIASDNTAMFNTAAVTIAAVYPDLSKGKEHFLREVRDHLRLHQKVHPNKPHVLCLTVLGKQNTPGQWQPVPVSWIKAAMRLASFEFGVREFHFWCNTGHGGTIALRYDIWFWQHAPALVREFVKGRTPVMVRLGRVFRRVV